MPVAEREPLPQRVNVGRPNQCSDSLSLPGWQTVSPDTSTLRIRLATPEHFHLNSLAPSELKLTSSNAPVHTYPAGSWGPPEADKLIAPRAWHLR